MVFDCDHTLYLVPVADQIDLDCVYNYSVDVSRTWKHVHVSCIIPATSNLVYMYICLYAVYSSYCISIRTCAQDRNQMQD